MRIIKLTLVSIAIVASFFAVCSLDTVRANRTANAFQDRDPMKPLQHVVASKTAKFGTVDKDDAAYKNALDAHDLAGGLKLGGKKGVFYGNIRKIYEGRDGGVMVF